MTDPTVNIIGKLVGFLQKNTIGTVLAVSWFCISVLFYEMINDRIYYNTIIDSQRKEYIQFESKCDERVTRIRNETLVILARQDSFYRQLIDRLYENRITNSNNQVK